MKSNESLAYLLGKKSTVKQIGKETGGQYQDTDDKVQRSYWLHRYVSKEGSYRYLYVMNGEIIGAVQLVAWDKGAPVITNAYVQPVFRLTNIARYLIGIARRDFPNAVFSIDRSEDGEALVKGIENGKA